MSQVAITAAQGSITGRVGRKQLIMKNTGESVVYFGWEPATSAAGATQGVPLEAGEALAIGGKDLDVSGPMYLICADGENSTVNYTERA